jgi:hypothetical protein
MHSAVLGELACGTWPNRRELLSLWSALPPAAEVSPAEAPYNRSDLPLLRAGSSHVSGTSWQGELKDRTSRRICLRPKPSSVSFNDRTADA